MSAESLDGSQLEGNEPMEPTQEEPSNKVPTFISGEPEAGTEASQEEEAVTGESAIPEKFQGKTVEEVVKSYVELESLNGKTVSTLGEEKQKRIQLEQRLSQLEKSLEEQGQLNGQSSQPQDKGELEGDLNELFYEKGADVVKTIVRDTMREELSTRDQAAEDANRKFLEDRDNEIASIAQSELEVIAMEKGDQGIPEVVLNQIIHIDKVDPAIQAIKDDPTLTPDRVRAETRKLYERAVNEVTQVGRALGGEPDPATLEAFNKAQRKSAGDSPSDTASPRTKPATQLDYKVEMMKKAGWGFLTENK